MTERKTRLLVADMEDWTVRYKFEWEPPLPLKKNDIVLWIIEELMDRDAYNWFTKQTKEVQEDICRTLIEVFKKDWKYMPVAMDEPLLDWDDDDY